MSGLDDLETSLGHRFADRALLTQALTHASAGAPVSNERFEFLGDRVLGLVIAGALLEQFPKAEEGELAVRLNALVRKETCAEIAQATGIAPHIILSPGERHLAGRSRKAVLGDACEAVIAALYLDGGLEAAARFIRSAWSQGLRSDLHAALDPKSELQVWALARADRALPSYRVLQSSGPAHAPHFVIEVSVSGAGAARGEGKSKREAEREAASALLAQGEAGMTRSAVIAVIGAPNAGKSTLVNRLVGAKVSIVTHKVQTTRMRVRGVMIEDDAQIVLVDTPGIFAPKRRLDRAMVSAAWAGAEDADAIVLIVDAAELAAKPNGLSAQDTDRIVAGLKNQSRSAALVLNKVDSLKREKLLDLAAKLNAAFAFEETFMVSALKGDGIDRLRTWLAAKAVEGPWYFPEDQTADISSRLLAAEITREQLYLRLHEELPYAAHVTTEAWQERKDGSVRIDQVILVARDGQKPIVIGKQGATLKAIGAAARKQIAEVLERPVHLFLTVKVQENWAEQRGVYDELGIEWKS